jgi:cytochrome c2
MAASDQTYRSQRALDVVFGVSCLLMLAGVVWMFAQDYYRDFKPEQRRFRDVEEAVAQRQVLQLVPDGNQQKEIDATEQELKQARDDRAAKSAELSSQTRQLLPEKAKAEARYQSIKADYDSVVSLYNIEIERRNAADLESTEGRSLANRAAQLAGRVQDLGARLDEAQLQVEDVNERLRQVKTAQADADQRVVKAEDKLKNLTADFDRFIKLVTQKKWTFWDTFRAWPILDAFASPTRIQQMTLSDLPIDYNFKQVTRYDRCTTCHLGIDQPKFARPALKYLTEAPSPEEDKKLATARELLEQRKKTLGDAAADPSQMQLTTLSTAELTPARVAEFCAHPRLDLFADANSPHPAEKFGCTICHSGQGSATEFTLAAHTPNDAAQAHEWKKTEGWERSHFWDFPMLPRRFIESSCLKCHYQVTDLLPEWGRVEMREGKKVEDPGAKVVKGYNLVRENGCFGCHEIASIKNGRQVGPDLRLEPYPPLESMTPSERTKMLADPLNPPGEQRKVGPSLRRISEKTNQQWARRWLESPRSFRPDTKMPHFYGLSNNNQDVLPDEQKKFPGTEIASIAYYLFRESADYLQGKDTYRTATQDRLKELEELQKNNLIAEGQRRELEEMQRRLQIATLPVPLSKELRDGEGQLVQLPPASTDDKARQAQLHNGRLLFTEKGCLACHSNDGTAERMGDLPAVISEQNFGPNLSRLAAKIAPEVGDADAKRRWLVQWIMNPNIHSPRTRMPITHLDASQAADIAAWLLSLNPGEWDVADVDPPSTQVLQKMADMYLNKQMPRQEVRRVLEAHGLSPEQEQQLKSKNPEADELRLSLSRANESWDDKLKWYIGRKAITALGCYGCHDIPGFDWSKPVGTPLNDWGKKDPERIAFEDVIAYVKKTHYAVEGIVDDKGQGYAPKDGKTPYERFYLDALEHHSREGFLNQKLREPRSYDYDRMRPWFDRLRMPQFRFARKVKPLEGETQEQADDRTEAEAREAVMTFILGLVAEPVPLQYVNDPRPDKLAEAKGKHVLEKYNCAGCHQIRPGIYEFKSSPALSEQLEERFKEVAADESYQNDNFRADGDPSFQAHNAWVGLPQPQPDRLTLHGLLTKEDEETMNIRLTDALRFTNPQKEARDIPAASFVGMPAKELTSRADPHGGTLVELLVPYLIERKPSPNLDDNPKARSGLPPPLNREGEKVQTEWLYQFLRDPYAIRKVTILRMPKFNMSPDEAMTLVNYFAAVDRLRNPGIGLTAPYAAIPEQNEDYLTRQSERYAQKLGPAQLDQRADKQGLTQTWDRLLQEQVAELQQAVQAADKQVADAKGDDKKDAEKRRDALREQLNKLSAYGKQKDNAYVQERKKDWREHEAYATDAYRLLANANLCLKCHQVGTIEANQPIGPTLTLTAQRLRPEWTRLWIASPQRLLIYPEGSHPMPQNFPRTKTEYQDIFAGTPIQQATAVRDVLMNYAKVADLPVDRYYRP